MQIAGTVMQHDEDGLHTNKLWAADSTRLVALHEAVAVGLLLPGRVRRRGEELQLLAGRQSAVPICVVAVHARCQEGCGSLRQLHPLPVGAGHSQQLPATRSFLEA